MCQGGGCPQPRTSPPPPQPQPRSSAQGMCQPHVHDQLLCCTLCLSHICIKDAAMGLHQVVICLLGVGEWCAAQPAEVGAAVARHVVAAVVLFDRGFAPALYMQGQVRHTVYDRDMAADSVVNNSTSKQQSQVCICITVAKSGGCRPMIQSQSQPFLRCVVRGMHTHAHAHLGHGLVCLAFHASNADWPQRPARCSAQVRPACHGSCACIIGARHTASIRVVSLLLTQLGFPINPQLVISCCL